MNREEALSYVREILPAKRYIHTLGVVETAKALAESIGEDAEKAELAAALHDMAKYQSRDELKRIIVDQKLDMRLLDFHHELWHGPVAAHLAKTELGIESEEVLLAIRYHTTGRANMTKLEQIVYLADYIEPGRKFPGVEKVREIAYTDFDKAMRKAVKQSILFLIEKKQRVFPDSLDCYNDLMLQKEKLKYERN
ncbi:bis(5'-nucleosyl)-tetraphosphatase (symmetrical) YqeK [Jeotgalibacillus aurantiacus]|uniref:bis(5'-nucleosyl)-tetraphosphatase (symmetrical) YqeK n=1 Tax=Jeotgalibacillus aurantiacus TaxID=2763266 RepID=UPI001D0A686F|nr:bis(5'-nucleosyl)-tetraphosphatase (symmetrical) YqeK [Jeotgalibacillus aurantiacus]